MKKTTGIFAMLFIMLMMCAMIPLVKADYYHDEMTSCSFMSGYMDEFGKWTCGEFHGLNEYVYWQNDYPVEHNKKAGHINERIWLDLYGVRACYPSGIFTLKMWTTRPSTGDKDGVQLRCVIGGSNPVATCYLETLTGIPIEGVGSPWSINTETYYITLVLKHRISYGETYETWAYRVEKTDKTTWQPTVLMDVYSITGAAQPAADLKYEWGINCNFGTMGYYLQFSLWHQYRNIGFHADPWECNGLVNMLDLWAVQQHYGKSLAEEGASWWYFGWIGTTSGQFYGKETSPFTFDINCDGVINMIDGWYISTKFGETW